MQIAVLVLRGSDKRSLAVVDRLGDSPSLFLLTWKHQLAMILGVALTTLLLWHGFLLALTRSKAPGVTTAAKPALVVPLASDCALHEGDMVAVGGQGPITAQKVVGLPRQSVVVRESGAPTRLLLLGVDRYYVTDKNGAGSVVSRSEIRGVVQLAQN